MNKVFKWNGIDDQGRKSEGIIVSEQSADAIAKLQATHITVLQLKRHYDFYGEQPIKKNEILRMLQQLAIFLENNVSLLHAIELLSSASKKIAYQLLLQTIKTDLMNGEQLSFALAKHPNYFDHFSLKMIRCAEHTGELAQSLLKLVHYQEKRIALHKNIRKMLIYPCSVIVTCFVTTLFLLIYIVPQFELLFVSFGKTLPVSTHYIMQLANFIHSHGWQIFSGITIFFTALTITCQKITVAQKILEKLQSTLPIYNGLLRKNISQRLAHTLGNGLGAGLTLMEALSLAVDMINYKQYSSSLLRVIDDIRCGESFSKAIAKTKLFPVMMISLIVTGEETGTLATTLELIAKLLEQEIEHHIAIFLKLIEPALLLSLGLVIGFFVLAMYIPIFQLGQG